MTRFLLRTLESLLFLSEYTAWPCLMIEVRSMMPLHQGEQLVFLSKLLLRWAQQAWKVSAMIGVLGITFRI